MKFLREWPFDLYAGLLLRAGLFVSASTAAICACSGRRSRFPPACGCSNRSSATANAPPNVTSARVAARCRRSIRLSGVNGALVNRKVLDATEHHEHL